MAVVVILELDADKSYALGSDRIGAHDVVLFPATGLTKGFYVLLLLKRAVTFVVVLLVPATPKLG